MRGSEVDENGSVLGEGLTRAQSKELLEPSVEEGCYDCKGEPQVTAPLAPTHAQLTPDVNMSVLRLSLVDGYMHTASPWQWLLVITTVTWHVTGRVVCDIIELTITVTITSANISDKLQKKRSRIPTEFMDEPVLRWFLHLELVSQSFEQLMSVNP